MAGRIPQQFVEQLLDRIDLVELIDARVPLKRSGRNFSARCPFHQEKTPSFTVSSEKQFYYCFGCGAGGNAISFLMDYDRLDFPQAVEALAHQAGIEVPHEATQYAARHEAKRETRESQHQILKEADELFQAQLKHHPQAKRAVDYLKGRGLTGQIAKAFGLGYAPPGWDSMWNRLGSDQHRQRLLIDSGLAIEREDGRCYDRFRDRVMFPIRDTRGRVIAFGGRVLGDEKPKYLNSPETELFQKNRELYGLYEARKANRELQRLLVVEGYMDVVSLAQFGINYAVATLGTATGPAHMQRIFRYTHEVVFCFDGDAAGRGAAARALEAVIPSLTDGRQARFLFLPEGEDPDTLVRKIGSERFQQMVAEATPLSEFFFEHVAKGLDLSSMDGRARLASIAAPQLAHLPDGVFKRLMLNALAERTGLGSDELSHATPATIPPQDSDRRPVSRKPIAKAKQQIQRTPPRLALALLVHQPELANQVEDLDAVRQLDDPDAPLLVHLLEFLKRRPHTSTHALLGYWLGTPEGEYLTQLAAQERLIPPEGMRQEFTDALDRIVHISKEKHSENWLRELADKPPVSYNMLSDEDKQQLRSLLDQLATRK